MIFGLVPALRASKIDLRLRGDERRDGDQVGRFRMLGVCRYRRKSLIMRLLWWVIVPAQYGIRSRGQWQL